MLNKNIFILSLLIYLGVANAVESGKVLQTSLSQETVVINYGEDDGIRAHDIGKFFYRPGFFKDKNLYVGQGKAIKVFSNRSFWAIDYDQGALKFDKNDEILLFRFKDYLRSQRDLEVDRRRFVFNLLSDDYQNLVLEDQGPTNLRKNFYLSSEFKESSALSLLRPTGPAAVNAFELDRWQYKKKGSFLDDKLDNSYFFYPKPILRTKSDDAILNDKLLKDFDLMIHSHFQLIGNPEINLLDYLKGKSKDVDIRLIYQKLSFDNTFDQVMLKSAEQEKEFKNYQEYLKQRAPDWSKGYSDAELIHEVDKNGLNRESDRQKMAIGSKISHEFSLGYYQGVYNNSLNESDRNPNYLRDNRSIDFSYELYLMRLRDEYYEYSLRPSFRHIKNYGSIGKENGEVTDNNFSLHLIFYPMHHPGRIDKILPFVGLGIGQGFSYIKENNQFLNNYNTLIFPSIIFGIKYRFHLNYAFNFGVVYENAMYRLADSRQNNEMPKSANISDIKAGLGISLYL